jgi:hypothetical protein
MKDAEFEEKEYEAPLYNQLLFGNHNIWTPGQVFEGKFGIDAALQSLNPLFWKLFGTYIPLGVHLSNFNWGFIWRKLGRNRQLPNFSVNLLVQSKRPIVLACARGVIYLHGIRGSFWRFAIKQHQQEILEKIAKELNRKALIIYASPAFDTLEQLFDFTQNYTIIENSSFVKVEKMIGHHHWNYNKPGTQGIALSEPEFIEAPPFQRLLRNLAEAYNPESTVEDELLFLHKFTFTVCQELAVSNPLARFIVRINERLSEAFRRMEFKVFSTGPFVNLLVTFYILDVEWFPIGRR